MLTSELLGRPCYDRDGNQLGRVIDLIAHQDTVTAVLVSKHVHTRLFGYERPGLQRPWVLEKLVRLIHRGTTEIPLDQIRWQP